LPRALALDLLADVLQRKRPLDEAFEAHPGMRRLEPRDRAFARNLAATTLRRLGQIDALIEHALERPLPPKARVAADILRLGICQLVFLETPPHAAVDTSVILAERNGQGPYKKLVNAVLRRIALQGAALAANQDAARLNTPDWLWRSWSHAYGDDTCRRIAESHLSVAPLDLSVKRHPEKWAERLGARLLPGGTLRFGDPPGQVTELPGFAEGAWWVQDCAAALPAKLLGDVAGKQVIDLCAAPGGKTAQLAAAGARVTAVDRSEKRLVRVAENLARLGLSAEIVTADATKWQPETLADAVLLDAPCSATGTIRRHPDIARLRAPADVAKLTDLQARLLDAAARMVKRGGLMVYAVCSLQAEEGPEMIETFSAPGLRLVPVTPEERFGLDDIITIRGTMRTLPIHHGDSGGMDGFFAARFERT
jgi:16S rRNA (cytosine967-C5)-methyltransferase